jgi:uncharacterized protein YjiS (DUF1127 family)
MSTTFQLPKVASGPARIGRAGLRRLTQAGVRVVRRGVDAWMLKQTIGKLEWLDDRMLADVGLSRSQIEPAVRQQMTRDWSVTKTT